MTDVHTAEPAADPDVAPNHTEVRDTFPPIAIVLCWGLGALAIVLGIVLGLTVVNN